MAYYAKISNNEFTVSERARLIEAQSEKGAIEANNRASEEWFTLMTTYQDILINGSEAELITAKNNLTAKEAEGTEALTSEIETLNTTIANALCRVTAMYTGADEFVSPDGDETEIDHTVYWESFNGGCKRTSYNTQGGVHKLGGTPFRKNYAGVGYIYDPVRDAFYSQQPYASWTLDESTCYWQPPTPRPEEGVWYWKEDTTEWVDYVYINPDNNQPYPSWTWDTTNGGWIPPVPKPDIDDPLGMLNWDEETLTWVER